MRVLTPGRLPQTGAAFFFTRSSVMGEGLIIPMPGGVSRVLKRLDEAGYGAWLVGGCLRDLYLGRSPKDWDIATSALPGEVEGLFHHTVPTGVKYGTVTVLVNEMTVEVTTFRTEGDYTDSRHPDCVRFESDIDADLSRRDFTVNAMAYHPERGWRDPYGGRMDCGAGVIRCVGAADTRFSEDALRMLRAVRFAAQLGFRLDEDTLRAIHRNAPAIHNIAGERIREEIVKLLLADHATKGVRLVGESGLGTYVLPQGAPDAFVWDPGPFPPDTVLRLSGWLWAAYGARQGAEDVLTRLRFDNDTKSEVLFLLDTQDIVPNPEPEWVRRRLYAWGRGRTELYLAFQEALDRPVAAVRDTLAGVIERGDCVSLRDLAVNGEDIMALGVKPGPAVGEVLERLMDIVLTEPSMNVKEKLVPLIEDQPHQ